eukprot:NODE_3653_length_759_cov_232.720170.p2 GENE.NODE_3653_length_759_cov_232.720170~~NODE_3653_length_759_cov_232.720170.p2  ORF type:complete len:210 (+),score=70.96 NODE_3653_length_759_cov_232.720170:38-667(+)
MCIRDRYQRRVHGGLSAITVMNMLIGVLCEVMSTVSAREKDEHAIKCLKKDILSELERHDEENNGRLSRQELENVLKDPKSLSLMRGLEIDIRYFQSSASMLFIKASDEVPIQTIMELFLNCRSDIDLTMKLLLDVTRVMLWNIRREVQDVKRLVLPRGLGTAAALAIADYTHDRGGGGDGSVDGGEGGVANCGGGGGSDSDSASVCIV